MESKQFNLLLGSGFSKALANIPTGIELSKEFYSQFISSQNDIKKKLAYYNFESYYSFGTRHSEIFQIESVCDFYRNIISLPQDQELQKINESTFDQNTKEELIRVVNERFLALFNYEVIAMIIGNYIASSNVLDANISKDLRGNLKLILKELEQKIFYTTNDQIQWNGNSKAQFILFLRYLLYHGYSINIFDLNHDRIFHDLIKSDAYLGNNYQDFFNESKIKSLYKNELLEGYEFDHGLPNKKINHYKVHGDFKILWDIEHGWLKLCEAQPWDFYKNRKYFRTSLLFDGNSKSVGIFNQEYHSFAYANLFTNITVSNPFMIIGYGFGDNHINAIINARYKDTKVEQYYWADNKMMLFCNDDIESIFHDLLPLSCNHYNSPYSGKYKIYHCSDNFENYFLPQFEKILNGYRGQIYS